MEYVNEKLEEFNNYIRGKNVAIIGLGVSNKPLIKYLYDLNANIVLFDNKDFDKIDEEILDYIYKYKLKYSFGKNYLSKLVGFDIIFKSPSCRYDLPEIETEVNRGAILTSEIELVMKLTPSKIIAVTGSDGKTTTTSLIYEILKNKYKCFLGGNIGIPLFTRISEMKPENIVILELSSFQLMGMEKSPDIAVLTNIAPNHLDIHKTYDEYIQAKVNLFKYQTKSDILVTNYDNEITKKLSKEAKAKVKFFSSKTKMENGIIYDDKIIKKCEDNLRRHILNVKEIKLKGTHNAEDICAAISATEGLVSLEEQIDAIKNFSGVKHRIEYVREIGGAKWYNDSIASSPTRTIAGLQSFDEKILLIAGGYDKHLDYEPIAKHIVEKVSTLILLGQTAEKIRGVVEKELNKQNKNLNIIKVESLEEAVIRARENVKPGEVVMLSPASASFDMFKNFEERGEKFKKLVNEL